jgi:hypothetical protein
MFDETCLYWIANQYNHAHVANTRAAMPHPSPPHQRTLAKQTLHQVHRQLGGAVANVKRGVEFYDVQRRQAPRVGDHFHAQLRFAVGGAAAHGGADAGGDVGV